MYLNVVAFDLDGTIAQNDQVNTQTWVKLAEAKEKGFKLMLVTGRCFDDLKAIGPFEEYCKAIVAENGALVYFPDNETLVMPFGQLANEVKDQLIASGIPLEIGKAIVATRVPHDKTVLEVLGKTNFAAIAEYNKGAIMVLPHGATKGSGLLFALNELGLSAHNMVSIGDAENDRSLFEQSELAVAVQNATEDIKKMSDLTLDAPNGTGVNAFLNQLINHKIPVHTPRTKQRIQIGHRLDQEEIFMRPLRLLNGNLCITGDSRSGKSWIAGLIIEKLLEQEYQVCVIDPEGDYYGINAFPHAIVMGRNDPKLPEVPDLLTLFEYSTTSIVLDMSSKPLNFQMEYVEELLHGLFSLKESRGKPQLVIMDEAHYFCGPENGAVKELIVKHMSHGGIALITFNPNLMDANVLEQVDHWLITKLQGSQQYDAIRPYLPALNNDEMREKLGHLPVGKAYMYCKNSDDTLHHQAEIIDFSHTRRIVRHIRHLNKYLRAPVQRSKQFYFHVPEGYDGAVTAANLWEFGRRLREVPLDTILFHIERMDFRRWAAEVLHDIELANRIQKITRRQLKGENLRHELVATVDLRFEELQKMV